MLHRVARPWRERRLRRAAPRVSCQGGCAGWAPGDSWRLGNSWPPGDSVYPWRPAGCDVGLGLGLGLGFWGGAGRALWSSWGKTTRAIAGLWPEL